MVKDTRVRILVVDNDPRVRAALQILLEQELAPVLVRESPDLDSIGVQFKDFRPEVVLLDWELPGRPAAALLFAIGGCDAKPKVIVLSRRPESEEAALAAGADAFVSKGEAPDRLLNIFRGLVNDLAIDAQQDLQPC